MKEKFLSEDETKEMICDLGKRMYMKGFVAANDGNISIKCSEDAIWATPTGVSKGFMTPDMMVKLTLKGEILAGNYMPSSEIKMHLRVYKENSEVKTVVHAHPPVCTAFAIAGMALDIPILPEAIVMLGIVPVAPYATPGTQGVPDSIAPFCRDYNGVLLANHGALTWGRDPIEAYYRLETMEHYAIILMHTENMHKKANELSDKEIKELIEIRNNMGIKAGGIPTTSK